MAHIGKVLEVAETFEKDLKGGTGYEGMSDILVSIFLKKSTDERGYDLDAMRSYT